MFLSFFFFLFIVGFSSSEFDVLRLWSGWAHTLRTKESRRKKEVDVEKSSNDNEKEKVKVNNHVEEKIEGSAEVDRGSVIPFKFQTNKILR